MGCFEGMKSFAFGVVTVLLLAANTELLAFGGEWGTEFERAQANAQATGVPLLVHFYADWCGPCQKMSQTVLHSPNVKTAIADRILAVKVNSDHRRDLVSRFGVTSLPTDVFLSPQGQVLQVYSGAASKITFLDRLTRHRAVTVVAKPQPVAKQPVVVVAAKPIFQETTASDIDTADAATSEVTDADSTADLTPAEHDAAATDTVQSSPTSDSPAAEDAKSSAEDTQPPISKTFTKTIRRESSMRIGLNGYCPVTLSQSSAWKKGGKELRHDYQGVSYLLTTARELELFKATPDKFVPALHGCDPVSLVNDQKVRTGVIELGARYDGRLFFFATADNLAAFLKTPADYSKTVKLAFFNSVSTTPPASDNNG